MKSFPHASDLPVSVPVSEDKLVIAGWNTSSRATVIVRCSHRSADELVADLQNGIGPAYIESIRVTETKTSRYIRKSKMDKYLGHTK